MKESFLYLFNGGNFKKVKVEVLPDDYLRILPDGEPTPFEDFGDCMLSEKDMTTNKAFEMFFAAV